MISNNLPRSLSSHVKRNLFQETAGLTLMLFIAYVIVFLCFIFFGRRDGFTIKLIILTVVGILFLIATVNSFRNYKKYIRLAENGKLIQAQITHIKPYTSAYDRLTYSYQINQETYSHTFDFEVNERQLFQSKDSLDILYDENNPNSSCLARYVFPDEYEKGPVDKTKRVATAVLGLLCMGLSFFEYFHISYLENQSTDGLIELYWIEGIPYSLFGKIGVTVLFACLGVLFIISAITMKKES